MRREVAQAQRFGLVDDQAEKPVPRRQLADLDDLVVGHPVVDERAQPPLAADVEHAQRGVLRVGEVARDRHDPGEDAVEREVGGHRDDRVEEQPQPGLLVEDAVDPGQHLAQQVVEL